MNAPFDLAGELGQASLLSLVGAGFLAALLHAALPTHWLPFVVVGRAQDWRRATVLLVAALAGLAHIASTAVIGSTLAWAGGLAPWIARATPYAAALVLAGFGLWYLARARFGATGLAEGERRPLPRRRASDAAAAWGLVGLMALSPGEALLPVYVGAGAHGWGVLALLTIAFAAGTILGMAGFTALVLAGVERFRLQRLAPFESTGLGLVLIVLAFVVLAANAA